MCLSACSCHLSVCACARACACVRVCVCVCAQVSMWFGNAWLCVLPCAPIDLRSEDPEHDRKGGEPLTMRGEAGIVGAVRPAVRPRPAEPQPGRLSGPSLRAFCPRRPHPPAARRDICLFVRSLIVVGWLFLCLHFRSTLRQGVHQTPLTCQARNNGSMRWKVD